ncbi:10694_t:CDS:2 [Funneliformis mosseae]|uniref:Beta-hexosaminidase n=1 Tax=Funneliformis mosseae TaxID=27381 RepID=A0A9N9A821_FUNMO|nr:10694_t:CDS:2 [Funneliformis mosseae]
MGAVRLYFTYILFLYILFNSQVLAMWPIPQSWSIGSETLKVFPSFDINCANIETSEELTQQIFEGAKNRVKEFLTDENYVSPNVHFETPENSLTLHSLTIEITGDKSSKLDLGIDESYELMIPCTNDKNDKPLIAHLKAATIFGVLHGLNTFTQLLYSNEEKNGLFLPFAPHNISDYPRFPHRGLLLDTARNYYPVNDLLKMLDVMSWNKFNVFHWHVVDAQSWPVKSEVYPELSEKGAYDPETMIYTKQDIKTIVEYAHHRGIRVIPEFDMPGHTFAISYSMPEIITCPDVQPNWNDFAAAPPSGQINPVLPATYEFLNNLIPEMTSWFPDKFYHAGGDEVVMNCWNTTDSVIDYLKEHPNDTSESLLGMFINELHSIVRKSGKTPITWQEMVVEHNLPLPKDVIVQVWTTQEIIKNVTERGYKVITGSADFWYLDCGHGGWVGDNPNGNSWCDPFKHWQRIYSYNPTMNLTKEEAKLVIGGEALLWSEQADPTNFESKLWPRASSAAEILWSGNYDESGNLRTTKEALPRLNDWRFRMVARGIKAEPLQPLWCVKNPGRY